MNVYHEAENFVENLRQLTRPRGTIASMIRSGKISEQTLHKVLSGKHNPTLVTAEKIADAAGLHLRSMLLPTDEFAELVSRKMAGSAK